MSDSPVETALNRIRALELELAQRIDDVRAESEAAVAEANHRARQAVEDARQRGEGRARQAFDRRVADAVADAERIGVDTSRRVERLLERLAPELDELTSRMVDTVLASGAGAGEQAGPGDRADGPDGRDGP